MDAFDLPRHISDLIAARNRLQEHYQEVLTRQGSETLLKFTLDGNLVGDLGEAIAVHLFDIRLVNGRSSEGVDGHAADGRSVQVKATGTRRGPAFRQTRVRAQHLLFFSLDFEECRGEVVYNGPEWRVMERLPSLFQGQRLVTARQIRQVAQTVLPKEKLPRID